VTCAISSNTHNSDCLFMSKIKTQTYETPVFHYRRGVNTEHVLAATHKTYHTICIFPIKACKADFYNTTTTRLSQTCVLIIIIRFTCFLNCAVSPCAVVNNNNKHPCQLNTSTSRIGSFSMPAAFWPTQLASLGRCCACSRVFLTNYGEMWNDISGWWNLMWM
jgi:hypothetical protein